MEEETHVRRREGGRKEGGLKQGASYHIGLHYIASLKHTVGQRRTAGRMFVRVWKGAKGASLVFILLLGCYCFVLGDIFVVAFLTC